MTLNGGTKRKMYFTQAGIHMHYAGAKGYVRLMRNGVVVKDLVPEETFRYDDPKQIE